MFKRLTELVVVAVIISGCSTASRVPYQNVEPNASSTTLRIVGNTYVYGGLSEEKCPSDLPVMVGPRNVKNGRDITKPDLIFPPLGTVKLEMPPRQAPEFSIVPAVYRAPEGDLAEGVGEFRVPVDRTFVLKNNEFSIFTSQTAYLVCPAQTRKFIFKKGMAYEARVGIEGGKCLFSIYALGQDDESANWTILSAMNSKVDACKK